MDVLLTHGYVLAEDPAERKVMRPYPPLGLLYIAAHLSERGFDVEVFDTTFRSLSELKARLRAERPPVVGIYGNLLTRANVLRVVAAAREVGARVVLGGPEPAGYAGAYLERGADVVVLGEGERAMEDLVPHLTARGTENLASIAGIVYRDDSGEVHETPPRAQMEDLDALAFPARDAIDLDAYVETWRRHHGRRAVSLITARGCPYRCRWCSHGVYGFTHRRRSPENVVREVEELIERYDPDLLWYADDVFTINKRWLAEYAEALARRGIRIPFETITREDRLDERVVETLARMGAERIWIGSESGSQRVLDAMERRTDAARVRDMVALLRRHEIQTGLFIMLGYEGEEIEDIEETTRHVKAANPDVFLTTLAYPIRGTAYYESVRERIVAPRPWEVSSDRELTVRGRRSRRFYDFANRWMVSEVRLDGLRRGNGATAARVVKMSRAYVNARIGRAGMRLWKREFVS